MKTLKIIIAVLLLLAVLPVSGCVFAQENSDVALREHLEEASSRLFTAQELFRMPDVVEKLDNNTGSLGLLVVCSFLFVLSAGIVLLVCRKKFYSGLISGGLVLIVFIWNISLQKSIQSVAADPILRRLEDIDYYENTSNLLLANILLFLPMIASLIVGIIETIFYFTKGKKNLVVENQPIEASPVVEKIAPQSNADELKKYKELLDAGVITQEEFDAKKKQLLGL